MNNETQQRSPRCWTTRRDEKRRRLQFISSWMSGLLLPKEKLVESLEVLIAPGDRIVLEGDNQKQADFLSRSLVGASFPSAQRCRFRPARSLILQPHKCFKTEA
jgi:malonate decarboxylase alpha subunit